MSQDSEARDRRWEFMKAFERLTIHDPASVARFLSGWQSEASSQVDGLSYELASYFCLKCGRDRAKHFRMLLRAHDPYVQVAGAVYLYFESPGEAFIALKNQMALPGDPGAWAALTLARRGDSQAMPRALEVLMERGPYTMDGVPHRNLQKRVVELLSNSAASSGLQLPADRNLQYFDPELDTFPVYADVYAWWQTNADKIKLRDPWLEVLDARKVD